MKYYQKTIFISILLLFTGLASADNNIQIESAYVREVPPGVITSASFLIINNTSNKDISLIGASSDVAKDVELHEHTNKDGMMEMRQVKEILISANGSTELKPSGFHIMLINLTRKIKSGDMIDISLVFNNGTKKTIKAEVKKVMQSMMN